MHHLQVPRGSTPLSYWGWRIWTMARPTLWRFGDGGKLFPGREVLLTLLEWMNCLLLREEMEYDPPTDRENSVLVLTAPDQRSIGSQVTG